MEGNVEFILRDVLAASRLPNNLYEISTTKDSFTVFINGTSYKYSIVEKKGGEKIRYEVDSYPDIKDALSQTDLPPGFSSVSLSIWLRIVRESLNIDTTPNDNVNIQADPVSYEYDASLGEKKSVNAEVKTEKLAINQNDVKVDAERNIKESESQDNSKTSSLENIIDDRGYSFSIRNEKVEGVIGVKEQAELLAEVILNFSAQERGNFIGLFGRWGRGKTFFWSELKKIIPGLIKNKSANPDRRISSEIQKIHLIEFHAWKYQDTPAVWAYLYETMAECYFKKGGIINFFYNFWKSIKLGWQRNRWSPIRTFIISIVILYLSTLSIAGLISNADFSNDKLILNFFSGLSLSWIPSIAAGIVAFGKWIYDNHRKLAKDVIHKYITKLSFKNLLGVQAEIQKEISFLLKTWIPEKKIGQEKLLLFVDDIDRCSEEKIIQIIDAIKVMLEDEEISKRLIVIAAIDENILKRAIQHKYCDLLEKDPSLDGEGKKLNLTKITREYIDKLFIIGIKLGALNEKERLEVLDSITKGRVLESGDKTLVENNTNQVEKLEKQEDELDDKPGTKYISGVDDNKVLNIGNPSFELISEELDRLKSLLDLYVDATPRAIRIFYFRYMLARNLKDIELGKDSSLQRLYKSNSLKELLPLLIINYSSTKTPSDLLDYKARILTEGENEVKLDLLGREYNVNRELLLKLLKVTEMVVPY